MSNPMQEWTDWCATTDEKVVSGDHWAGVVNVRVAPHGSQPFVGWDVEIQGVYCVLCRTLTNCEIGRLAYSLLRVRRATTDFTNMPTN